MFAVTPYGHWHAKELELYVRDLDMAPMDAILTATKNNMLALRNGSQVGVHEVSDRAPAVLPRASVAIRRAPSRRARRCLRRLPVLRAGG